MLSKDVFKDRMLYLTYMYPSWGIQLDNSDVMKAWYEALKDFNEHSFKSAIDKHVKKERFNPTIASILECKDVIDDYFSRTEI